LLVVKYRRKYLEKCYRKKDEAVKKLSKPIAENYIKRLSLIYSANTIDDLYSFPQLKFHPLKGKLGDKHSIKITNRARLIVTIENDNTIIIEEMTRHYE